MVTSRRTTRAVGRSAREICWFSSRSAPPGGRCRLAVSGWRGVVGDRARHGGEIVRGRASVQTLWTRVTVVSSELGLYTYHSTRPRHQDRVRGNNARRLSSFPGNSEAPAQRRKHLFRHTPQKVSKRGKCVPLDSHQAARSWPDFFRRAAATRAGVSETMILGSVTPGRVLSSSFR